jgi:SAM-dependent methyltransferase
MLSAQDLDRFAREYYLSDDIADHGIENTLQRASAPRILGQLAPGERVLEMGYGDGLLTADLVGRGVALDLLEGSPLLCQEATRRYGDKIAVHCGLFEEFAAGPVYDTVLALHVIEHVSEPITTLREIARWLKPGGKLILVVPNRASVHRDVALRMGLIGALDELSPRDHLVGHLRVYDFAMLEADLAGAGFRVEHRFGSFLKTVPNSMMMDYPEALLNALDAISDSLPPEILANIGVRAVLA